MAERRGKPRTERGHPGIRYVATLINPVDQRLYDIVYLTTVGDAYVVAPLPNEPP